MRYIFQIKGAAHAGDIAGILEVPGLKLKAAAKGDEVNGHVTCSGNLCEVIVYEADDPAIKPGKSSPFKRPLIMPTQADFESHLRAAGKID